MTLATRTAVDRFLDAICSGRGVPADLLAPGVVLDATVPGWRFSLHGQDGVARKYGDWFENTSELEELDRRATAEGEVVTYLATWVERGIPHAARHCHVLTLDRDGRIVHDQFFCGGRWDAARLAEMAAAQHAGG